jgi:hypothetical protein
MAAAVIRIGALGLPTLENPSRGTGSGIMETIRNYGYDIVPLASLLSTVALMPTCIVAAGRGYGDNPSARVQVVSDRDWVVRLDISADEYHGSEQVKRALVRYPIKVVRLDVNPTRNPFGLALDCYDGALQRITVPTAEPPGNAGLNLQGVTP